MNKYLISYEVEVKKHVIVENENEDFSKINFADYETIEETETTKVSNVEVKLI